MKSFKFRAPSGVLVRQIMSIVTIISVLVLGITIIISGFFPLKYLLVAIVCLILVESAILALLLKGASNKTASIIGYVVSIIVILVSMGGIYAITNSLSLINRVSANSTVSKKEIDNSKSFNVYISGIDTYGDISTVSRSDVNIVATINPATKRILLTTIPRDSYVPIAGGGNNQLDKLTHSGIYGIDASMQSVSSLLNTKIDNYIRINFSSFMNVVDGIGGITVSNPVTFTTDGGQVFKQGDIYLNGEDALTFSRERHNLDGGDNDRGKNQERVITAILHKLMSPGVIYHYQNVMSVIGDSVQTNISSKSITELISSQIDSGSAWTIESTAITGKGQTGGLPSYAMPGSQLYMFVIDPVSLQQAKNRINAALNN